MTLAWKLIPTLALAGILVAGVTVRPPRAPVTPRELIRLVVGVSALYLVGGGALLAHRTGLAALVFGAGLALCALAVWLSRGTTPPRRGDGEAPPRPVDPPPVDFVWTFYEDEFREPVA